MDDQKESLQSFLCRIGYPQPEILATFTANQITTVTALTGYNQEELVKIGCRPILAKKIANTLAPQNSTQTHRGNEMPSHFNVPKSEPTGLNNNTRIAEMLLEVKGIDIYRFIGVPSTASSDEIKMKFKELSIQWHPDKNPDVDPAKFQMLTKINSILRDQESRRAYNEMYGYGTALNTALRAQQSKYDELSKRDAECDAKNQEKVKKFEEKIVQKQKEDKMKEEAERLRLAKQLEEVTQKRLEEQKREEEERQRKLREEQERQRLVWEEQERQRLLWIEQERQRLLWAEQERQRMLREAEERIKREAEQERQRLLREAEERRKREAEQERQRLLREAEERRKREEWERQRFLREAEERRKREEQNNNPSFFHQVGNYIFTGSSHTTTRPEVVPIASGFATTVADFSPHQERQRLVLRFKQHEKWLTVSCKISYDDLFVLVENTFSEQLKYYKVAGLFLGGKLKLNPENISYLKDLEVLEVHVK